MKETPSTYASGITVRAAVARDQSTIRRLVLQNNLNPFGLDWRNFLVAVNEQQDFVGCGQSRHHDGINELASLMVVDQWQGKGVSNLLIDELLQRSERPLWLMCESRLVAYYQKFGFDEVKDVNHLPHYFRSVNWLSRYALGLVFFVRGTYVAFMILTE